MRIGGNASSVTVLTPRATYIVEKVIAFGGNTYRTAASHRKAVVLAVKTIIFNIRGQYFGFSVYY